MTANQPELKACPPNQELFDLIAEQTGKVLLQSELNDIINLVLKLNSHSPIIQEDAYPKPVEEKTVPDEFDKIITGDALQEAVRRLRDANGYASIADYGADIETLVNHAIKGRSK